MSEPTFDFNGIASDVSRRDFLQILVGRGATNE
jgi:hypothetical protein